MGCLGIAQNVSDGVTNPVALRRTACTTPAWNPGGLEQTGKPRMTTIAEKPRVVQTEAFPAAPPSPTSAVDPAARRAVALSLLTPNARVEGRGERD